VTSAFSQDISVISTTSSGHPVVFAYENQYGSRITTQILSIKASDKIISDQAGLANLAKLYQNSIKWLLNSKKENQPTESASKAIYYSKTKTLYLEGILVPFIDEFSGEETDIKGIFDAQLQEQSRFEFELIASSITFSNMSEGKDTSGYILYNHKKRSVKIPCFKVMTIAKFGNGIEGKAIYYKDVILKQRHPADLIFHAEDMTKTDTCN
jgi:hypothetical protein